MSDQGGASDGVRQHLLEQSPPWYDPATDSWRLVEAKQASRPAAAPQIDMPHLNLLEILAWLLIGAVVAGLAWFLWELLRGRSVIPQASLPDTAVRTVPRAAISELDLGDERSPEEALAAARAAGDWSRAIVWLYALLLVRLDHAGALRLRRGTTNRRYRREASTWNSAPSDLLPVLDATIGAFERVYFGRQPAAAAEVDVLERRIRALALGDRS